MKYKILRILYDKYLKNMFKSSNPLFENCGKIWSKEDDANVMKLIEEGKTIQEIALIHKRTEGGIIGRLYERARKLQNNGVSNDDIKIQLKYLTIEDIEKAILRVKQPKKQSTNEIQQMKNEIENLKLELNNMKDVVKMLCTIESLRSNNDYNNVVQTLKKQGTVEQPTQIKEQKSENIWTNDLIENMIKYKDNKKMLKKVRKTYCISRDDFYTKLETL